MIKDHPGKPVAGPSSGLLLIELVIALGLAALLLLGLVQIVSAASASTQLQRNQAMVQENSRLAFITLSRVIHRAGFSPEPWNPLFVPLGVAAESQDAFSGNSDRLVLRDWSDLNCYDNRNPEVDATGNPSFFVREVSFDINSDKSLTRQCRYGPTLDNLTTQVRRQGFINGVDAFQVQYGLDSDRNGSMETWVRAGEWPDPQSIVGIRVALLIMGPDAVVAPVAKAHRVLELTVSRPADGRLRRVLRFTAALRGRTG